MRDGQHQLGNGVTQHRPAHRWTSQKDGSTGRIEAAPTRQWPLLKRGCRSRTLGMDRQTNSGGFKKMMADQGGEIHVHPISKSAPAGSNTPPTSRGTRTSRGARGCDPSKKWPCRTNSRTGLTRTTCIPDAHPKQRVQSVAYATDGQTNNPQHSGSNVYEWFKQTQAPVEEGVSSSLRRCRLLPLRPPI